MNTATQAVSEEKREPITKTEPTEQLKVTGQWLYDTFIVSDEASVTRMQQLRKLVADGVDAFQLKGACDKMVERAKEDDIKAGIPEKIVNAKGKEVPNRGPKQQYAMNVRTILQQAWGAMKFAMPELEKLGYTDQTGYNPMAPMAKKALQARGIDWKGEKVKDEAQREKDRLKRAQKAESQVMAQAVIENPRLPGESEAEWVARVAEAAREEAQAAHERAEAEVIKTVVSKLFEQHGDNVDRMRNIAMAIFDTLASRLGVDFEYTTAEVDDRQPEHVIDEAPTDGVTTTAEHPEVAHHE